MTPPCCSRLPCRRVADPMLSFLTKNQVKFNFCSSNCAEMFQAENDLDQIDSKKDQPFVWEPWEEFKEDLEVLPIDEPPCKHCKHWRPLRTYNWNGEFNGLVLCHFSGKRPCDFSCFESRIK